MEKFHIYIGNAYNADPNADNCSTVCKKADTLQDARAMVRDMIVSAERPEEIIVHVPAGLYKPDDFVFTENDCSPDCHVTYAAEAGAVIHGGLTVSDEHWKLPCETIVTRFDESIRDKIRMIDLAEYGLSKADWGEPQAIGAFVTTDKYTDVPQGCRCEMFCGDTRMTLARYPNHSFARLEAIMDVGDCAEFPAQNYYRDWGERKNHRGGVYVMDRATCNHVQKWQSDETAWMFGYFMWDWADSSTPVKIDKVNRRLFPTYVSRYGATAGALYYFYNVLEELDIPGEWYLDRDTAKLYFYPIDGGKTVDFYYKEQPLIHCTNTVNMTFSGFTCQCTMGNAVVVSGCRMTFDGLTVKNIAGTAFTCTGYDNIVGNCEIFHTGKGGIYITGGDRKTLTPGKNRVTNNYIHDYAQVFLTYQPGVQMSGVGNLCDHNEICHSPHMAISYSGNEHIFEYNYIHHVVLQSSDAGAIYAGFDWAAHGCVIRYNRLEHIGSDDFQPDGVYWDDGHSGQTAYGNLLIDVKKNGIMAGGGRENKVQNNVLIHCACALQYDDRNRDGFVNDGWARAATNTPDAPHWQHLKAVPFNQGIWKEKYPLLSKIIFDFNQYNDPDFPINPTYSTVSENVVIDKNGYLGRIVPSVYEYSTVENNKVYASPKDAGLDTETWLFAPDSPVFREVEGFKQLPVAEMGRKK